MGRLLKNAIFILISITILALAFMLNVAVVKDNLIMRENNTAMRSELAQMKEQQKQIESKIRQVQADSDVVLRIVTSGTYEKE